MPADNINGPKPPVLEVTKSADEKLAVNPESKSFNETLHSLRNKVASFFSHSNKNPVDTLLQLASQEIPEDQSPLQEQEEKPSPTNIGNVSYDRKNDIQEAQRLSQQIKSEVTKNPENQTIPETLFPDQPSLYDRYHRQYEHEKKTIKGAVTRSFNIRRLHKEGLTKSEAREVYDSLRSRGISPDRIKIPTSSQYNYYGFEPKTDEQLIDILKKAPQIIDRLNLIGIGEEPGSIDVESLSDSILNLSNEQFNKRYSQIRPIIFLDKGNVLDIMTRSTSNPQVDAFIEHFRKNILSGQNQYDKIFDSFKPCLIRMFESGSLSQHDIFEYFENFVFSDINPDQSITIPKELVDQAPSNRGNDEEKVIKYLLNIQDRQQQKYLLNTFKKMPGYFNAPRDYLFQSELPTIDFFREYVGSKYYQGEHISIPESTLNLISAPDDPTELIENIERRTFYQHVSNLSNPKIQQICFDTDTKYTIPKYFDETGKPTGRLLFRYLKSVDRLDNWQLPQIEPEYLSTLSIEDQNKLNFTIFIRDFLFDAKLDTANYDIVINRILENFNSINAYMGNEGQPNSIFYKTLLSRFANLLGDKPTKYILDSIGRDAIDTFEPNEKKLWKGVMSLKDVNTFQLARICEPDDIQINFFDQNGLPTNFLFTYLGRLDSTISQEFLLSNLTQEVIQSYSPEDQKFWKGVSSLKNLNQDQLSAIIQFRRDDNQSGSFIGDHLPTNYLFYSLFNSGTLDKVFLTDNLTPEILNTYSHEDKTIWNFIIQHDDIIHDRTLLFYLFNHRHQIDNFINNNQLTEKFYRQYASDNPEYFIKSFDKEIWEKIFGKDLINNLLNSLPRSKSNDEKRNAFTHNQYDRTSKFFIELVCTEKIGFQLNPENIKIATEYIQVYGLANNSEFYNYFQILYKHQSDPSITLPIELVENQIDTLEKLNQEIKKIQKICFSQEPLVSLSELTPFQINLISIITGHSNNRFTRIPIDRIIPDFSLDMESGDIAPLSKEFHPEIISSSLVETRVDRKITDSQILTTTKQEILSAIDNPSNPSFEKSLISDMLSQRITSLYQDFEKVDPEKPKKQEFILKQIDVIKQKLEEISTTDTTDSLLATLVTFNYGLGSDQEKFNSVLRQLVFKKVFEKHQNSPDWQESLKVSLENETATVDAVNNMLNLINNTIKDHALNFETQNQDGYWDELTFQTMKKFSSVFKKNLSLSTYIRELESFKQSFVTTNMGIDENISVVPDRGLIGEMSGYMADVCYTRVYPLLKQFPDLVPYKFISNPDSESPSFIGSTLVFKVEGSDNQPVFLIRAFDIPQEQSYDIGKFFESFVDHLASIAKNAGVKKIIIAGTDGTISNYTNTKEYVFTKYVKGKEFFPLKEKFDFNNYDITSECYLVRDLSSAEMPGNEPGSESRQ